LNYENFFISYRVNPHSTVYKWNLNKIPSGCDQILALAELITACKNQEKTVKLRPDKRKRAKGLLVIFANDLVCSETENSTPAIPAAKTFDISKKNYNT
jgi:hypothetical protein